MRLTLQTDYAFRMLMQLAVSGDERVTIADVAERYGVSRHHLMKVASLLTRHGFVEGARGRSGGLALTKPAATIRLGDVFRATEPDLALVECFKPGGACLVTPSCRLKGVLGEALGAFLDVLDRYSLEDMVRGDAALEGLLAPQTVDAS